MQARRLLHLALLVAFLAHLDAQVLNRLPQNESLDCLPIDDLIMPSLALLDNGRRARRSALVEHDASRSALRVVLAVVRTVLRVVSRKIFTCEFFFALSNRRM